MNNFSKFLTSAVLLILFLLILFGKGLLAEKYAQGSAFLANVFSGVDRKEIKTLQNKNEQLRFKIKKLQQFNSSVDENKYLESRVFSKYPFNNRELITIDAGRQDGIEKGMPVLTPSKYLLGQVKSVRSRISQVNTIFDSDWKNSVGLGEPKIKAVLKGSTPPTISLVPENPKVKEGVKVFNISPDYPIYQLMGELQQLESSQEEVLKEGKLAVPYQLENLEKVLVITNFP